MKHDFSAKTTESSDIPLSPCLSKFVTVTIKNPVTPPFKQIFYHPDSGWSRDQPQPGSLFQRPREAEKRDPGNEVGLMKAEMQLGTWRLKVNSA